MSTLLRGADIALPKSFASKALLDNAALLEMGLRGADGGIHSTGDLLTRAADGTDLNVLWREFQQTLEIQNRSRGTIVDFLTYTVTEPVVTVPQFGSEAEFELASEYGLPRSRRSKASYFQMGFDFDWYDTGARFSWQFLADATTEQIQAVNASVLAADSRLVFNEVMKTLFDNTNRNATINGNAYTVYGLYNADGTVPPAYKTNTFSGTHTHYLDSGAATVDSGDLDEIETHITHHGYTPESGVDIILMVNKTETATIRNFRTPLNGGTATYDFIAAQGQPNILIPRDRLLADGQTRPPAQIRGMKVVGAYGNMTIVEEDYIPAGYMVAFATGGTESLANPIGIREHSNPALRGLRLVKGRNDDYPLQDSYWLRGFGTGIRQRGAAVVMRVGVAAYSPPAAYTR